MFNMELLSHIPHIFLIKLGIIINYQNPRKPIPINDIFHINEITLLLFIQQELLFIPT
jgi:hypothetical protein